MAPLFSCTGLDTTSRTSYTKNWASVKSLLKEIGDADEETFYRIEEMERLTKNDAAIYGYKLHTKTPAAPAKNPENAARARQNLRY